jgi:DNA-binding PadR family transcriptional regulator
VNRGKDPLAKPLSFGQAHILILVNRHQPVNGAGLMRFDKDLDGKSVYQQLQRLEEKGLLSSEKQPGAFRDVAPRSFYKMTDLGKQVLERWHKETK